MTRFPPSMVALFPTMQFLNVVNEPARTSSPSTAPNDGRMTVPPISIRDALVQVVT